MHQFTAERPHQELIAQVESTLGQWLEAYECQVRIVVLEAPIIIHSSMNNGPSYPEYFWIDSVQVAMPNGNIVRAEFMDRLHLPELSTPEEFFRFAHDIQDYICEQEGLPKDFDAAYGNIWRKRKALIDTL